MKLAAANAKPTGITLDPSGASQSIWIVDESSDTVYEYGDARSRIDGTGTVTSTFKLVASNTGSQGIADPMAWRVEEPGLAAARYDAALPMFADAGETVPLIGWQGGLELQFMLSSASSAANRARKGPDFFAPCPANDRRYRRSTSCRRRNRPRLASALCRCFLTVLGLMPMCRPTSLLVSVTQQYADAIGADGYSENASSAVALARRLCYTL